MAQTMAEYLVEQGIKQGETRAKQESVLKLTGLRLDSVPESVTNQIRLMRDHARLDSIFEQAVVAQTLDEIDWQTDDG